MGKTKEQNEFKELVMRFVRENKDYLESIGVSRWEDVEDMIYAYFQMVKELFNHYDLPVIRFPYIGRLIVSPHRVLRAAFMLEKKFKEEKISREAFEFDMRVYINWIDKNMYQFRKKWHKESAEKLLERYGYLLYD